MSCTAMALLKKGFALELPKVVDVRMAIPGDSIFDKPMTQWLQIWTMKRAGASDFPSELALGLRKQVLLFEKAQEDYRSHGRCGPSHDHLAWNPDQGQGDGEQEENPD